MSKNKNTQVTTIQSNENERAYSERDSLNFKPKITSWYAIKIKQSIEQTHKSLY